MKLTQLPKRQQTSSKDITRTGLLTSILKSKVFLMRSLLHTKLASGKTVWLKAGQVPPPHRKSSAAATLHEGRMVEEEGRGDPGLCWLKMPYSSLTEVYGPPQRSAAPIWNLQGELLTDNEAIIRDDQNTLSSSLTGHHRLSPLLLKRSQQDPYIWNLTTHPRSIRWEKQLMSCNVANQQAPMAFRLMCLKQVVSCKYKKFTEFRCTCCEDGSLLQDLKDAGIVHP